MLNNRNYIYLRRLLSLLAIAAIVLAAAPDASAKPKRAARKKVVGVVTDSVNGERLSFVNVYSKKNKTGTTTDLNGVFTLYLPAGADIDVTSLGYNPMVKRVGAGSDTLRFQMSPSTTDLAEVVVKPKKQKYSKKNNPAVELMRRVRADRDRHDPTREPYYSYDRYDKMVLGLNNYKGYLPGDDGKIKGKFKSIAEPCRHCRMDGKTSPRPLDEGEGCDAYHHRRRY